MKDALGHGSDSSGGGKEPAHASGIVAKVQQFVRDESGAGKVMLGEGAFEKMHDPAMVASAFAEAAAGDPSAIAHLLHIMGVFGLIAVLDLLTMHTG